MEETNPYTQFTTEIKESAVKDGSYWKAKHAFARAFYATFRDSMMELWKKTNEKKTLRPKIWVDFVESPDLWNMIYDKLITMSYVTIDMCAFAELVEEGMDALVDNESYFLVPLMHAMVPSDGESVLQTIETEGKKRYACQQLLKTMLIYFMADLRGKKKFTVYFMSHESMEVNCDTTMEPLFPPKK